MTLSDRIDEVAVDIGDLAGRVDEIEFSTADGRLSRTVEALEGRLSMVEVCLLKLIKILEAADIIEISRPETRRS